MKSLYTIRFVRFALFLVYFWFGILKIFDLSPANPLVQNLLEVTMPFLTFGSFIVFFGYFEMLIGITFLFPRFLRLSLILLAGHLVMTALPLVLLPNMAWHAFMVPTLEGQYIIKNILIISLALVLSNNQKTVKKKSLAR